jgi:hypothetical protein
MKVFARVGDDRNVVPWEAAFERQQIEIDVSYSILLIRLPLVQGFLTCSDPLVWHHL